MNTHEEDASMAATSVGTEASPTRAILNMSIDNTENAEDGEEFDLEQVRKREVLQRKARVIQCEKESQTTASPCAKRYRAKPLRVIIPLH